MPRSSSPTTLALASVVVFSGLVVALCWREHDHHSRARDRAVIVYAAPTSRLPLEAIVAEFEAETGQRVELRFGASEDILTKLRFPSPVEPGDVFIPADNSYVRQARELGLAAESISVARVRGVLLLAKGNPKGIARWGDLHRDGVKVAVPNPGAAVGKLARDHLARTGRWATLERRVVDSGSVTEAANAAKTGTVDAAIVWDAVAVGPAYRGQTILDLPELDGVNGTIEVAVLSRSRDPIAALRFARYVAAPDHGLRHFREAGFRVEEGADGRGGKP